MKKTSILPKAFTLTELLFVIAIITALVAMLMPAFKAARDQTNRIKCVSNMRQIGLGIFAYTAENQGLLPYARWIGGVATKDIWCELVAPYLNIPVTSTMTDKITVFACPSHKDKQVFSGYSFRLSYGVVVSGGVGGVYRTGLYEPGDLWHRDLRLHEFTKPGEEAMLAENNNYYRFIYWTAPAPYTSDSLPNGNYMKWHHKSHMNCLFADGHVESLTKKQFSDRLYNVNDKFMRGL